MWNELKKIKSSNKELREFGLTIGAILAILGGIALWRAKATAPYFLGSGLALIFLGIAAPAVLKPLQKAWMALGVVLGFFVSRVILFIFFYLAVTPMGLITRILGKDILDQRIYKEKGSYWIKRPVTPEDKKSYENQY